MCEPRTDARTLAALKRRVVIEEPRDRIFRRVADGRLPIRRSPALAVALRALAPFLRRVAPLADGRVKCRAENAFRPERVLDVLLEQYVLVGDGRRRCRCFLWIRHLSGSRRVFVGDADGRDTERGEHGECEGDGSPHPFSAGFRWLQTAFLGEPRP